MHYADENICTFSVSRPTCFVSSSLNFDIPLSVTVAGGRDMPAGSGATGVAAESTTSGGERPTAKPLQLCGPGPTSGHCRCGHAEDESSG